MRGGIVLSIRVVMAPAAAVVLSGCASNFEDPGSPPGEILPMVVLETRPLVEVLYPTPGDPEWVEDNQTREIETNGDEVTYFTVRVPYLHDDSDSDSQKHDVLHYVIGGYQEDCTVGHVVVNGVKRDGSGAAEFKPGGGAALITVQDGWVWVSNCPPPNWIKCVATGGGNAEALGVPAAAPATEDGVMIESVGDVWVGWSILTLLKAEWTWAGAIGTKFIYRVDPADSPAPDDGGECKNAESPGVEKVYSLDGEPALHSAQVLIGDKPIKQYQV
ncbi:MAG: hypothetical protein K8E66_02840, partial [Phycisphaerales bacterium]|nr:hypothetical protein [Phycisphaerales bacterium]